MSSPQHPLHPAEQAKNDYTILLIASPTAGKQTLTVARVEAALRYQNVRYDKVLVHNPAEASAAAKKGLRKHYAAVAVFGGDGTVSAVLRTVVDTEVPVLILPGGSGNVIAKAVGVPLNIGQYIRAFAENRYILKYIPVASANGEPFTLYSHFGLFSRSIHATPKSLKRWIGEHAYRVSTARMVPTARKQLYELEIDGRLERCEGYACSILNIGDQYLFGVQVWPKTRYGFLRVMIVRQKSIWQLLQWYLLLLVAGHNLHRVVTVWQAEKIKVLQAPKMMSFDDQRRPSELPLTITANAHTVRIVTPVMTNNNLRGYSRWLQMFLYRNVDQVQRVFTGIPSTRFSRISKQLYVGGQYNKRALKVFQERGITGIVNMRINRSVRPPHGSGIEVLHLATVDMTAPTLGHLERGVAFIEKHIRKGGAVYVHCHLGEGRGPTMAAAYLIHQGMRPQDAIAHMQRYRPFARPNKKQIRRLMQFAERINKST